MELPDREVCYRALQSRDPRFDGLLFVGVTSTGVYCRPVCPARMPMTEVALAAGFGSIRRFNETFKHLFHRPPNTLRRKSYASPADAAVALRLRYRPPYDWDSMLAYLQARAIPGVESVEKETYH